MPAHTRFIAMMLALVSSAAFCFAGCSDTAEESEKIGIEAPPEEEYVFEEELNTQIPFEPDEEPDFTENSGNTQNGLTEPPETSQAQTAAPAPTAEPTPTPEVITEMYYVPGYTNEKFVNFRSKPSTNADILKICKYGTSLFVTGRLSKWFRVVIDNKIGYISRPFVTCGELTTPKPTPKPAPPMYTVSPGQFSDYEISLVAALIHKEGPGSTKKGYRAIASVILNRVLNKSKWFPDTVEGVLFQAGQFGYTREELESVHPNSTALKAAKYVFSSHGSILPKKVLFYRASYLGHNWAYYMSYYATIEGNCYFYGKYFY